LPVARIGDEEEKLITDVLDEVASFRFIRSASRLGSVEKRKRY